MNEHIPELKALASIHIKSSMEEAYMKGFSDGYLKALLDEKAGKTNEDKPII